MGQEQSVEQPSGSKHEFSKHDSESDVHFHLWGNKKDHEFLITVPPAVKPGEYFPIIINGRQFIVQCPPGNRGGDKLIIDPPKDEGTDQYICTIPAGVREGEQFRANIHGEEYKVTCPAGARAGEKVTFNIPRPPVKIQARSARRAYIKSSFDIEDFKDVRRVALLKKIEATTAAIFKATVIDNQQSPEMREKLSRVILESNLAGIEEFSEEWYSLISAKMVRMQLCRDFCIRAMVELGENSGFSLFERKLIIGCTRISSLYDAYYLAYLHAVQDPKMNSTIEKHPPSQTKHKDCFSHYTMIQLDSKGNYQAIPFAKYFKDVIGPITSAMDALVEALRVVPDRTASDNTYIAYLEQYRRCLALEGSSEELEEAWTELDRKWMDTRGPIQIVHDIETGYGDALRIKATPDFSLRFLDDTFTGENDTIRQIQGVMTEYFQARDQPICKNSLQALSNTMAGIYYIPFKTGISLQFSFSGQSIPNRVNVSQEKGVKIYFDAIETEARIQLNLKYIRSVYYDPDGVVAKYKPNAIEQLVWHVAAHEVGHAIYNLSAIEKSISNPEICSLLEEPRAELTAMFTMKLLYEKGILTLAHLQEALAHFALDALRYFAKYSSQALRPYIIFQIYAYKVYVEHGYLAYNDVGSVYIEDSKALEVLQVFHDCYLAILDCEDRADGAGLQTILDGMTTETPFVKSVVDKVFRP